MVSESQTSSVGFPYERQAMNGNEMPSGLDYPDQVAFLCFRMLYAQLRMGLIDRESAVREKRQIMREHAQHKFTEQLCRQWVQNIKQTEMARSAYMKCRTLENADQLLIAIEGGDYRKKEGGVDYGKN